MDSPVALIELYRRDHQQKAWTDVGGVGVVRRPTLRKIVKFSQGLSNLGLDPVRTPYACKY